ncbi:MAG: RNA polymerase subunit sigma-24 [Candidatus Rokuibacteriota bacterium]|nr:MAG: RNA polymerase subunit sigma-24 [Candidatus Rokubacteria bacterium]
MSTTTTPCAAAITRGAGSRTEAMADSDFQGQALAHLDALHNFAMYLTRNPAEAEDLVQETYLRAFRFSHRFQPGTHLRAWLFQILRNTFLTFYRLRERELPLAEDGVPDWDAPMFHEAPAEDPSVLEAHTDLERAMRRLPDDFRTVLLLAEVEGLPLEEVAQIMACPVGTVKSRIFRAKERLRAILRDYEKI